jgi:hypothetical protein
MTHGCEVCVKGRYHDDAHHHRTLCGLKLTGVKNAPTVIDGDGLDGMKGVDCAACLVAFDEYAMKETPW